MTTHPAAQVHAHAQARGAGTDRHRLSQARIRRTVGPVEGGRRTPAPWKRDSRAQPSPNRVGRRFPRPSNGPTKIVKSTVAQDRKSFLPVKKAALRYGLEPHVSHPIRFWAWKRWEAHGVCHLPAGRLLGMVTSIWCRDRPAMHSSNGPLFHAGSSTKTPPPPIPRSAATSRTVQTPKLAKS